MPAHVVFPLMLIRSAGLPFGSLAALAVDWKTAESGLAVGQAELYAAAQAVQATFDLALQELEDETLRTPVYNFRKSFFKKNKLPPAAELARWSANNRYPALVRLAAAIASYLGAVEKLNRAEITFHELYETALITGYQALQRQAGKELFQRAQLFASHALLDNLVRFIQTPVASFSKKERQIAQAVLQYTGRMATKTTPLSRLATVAVCALDKTDPAEAAPFGKIVVTPNVALLEALYAVLLSEPAFYRELYVQLNPCITEVPTGAFNWLYFDGETESFQEAEADGFLQFLAELLLKNERQLSFEKLLDELGAAVEAEHADLEQQLLELLDLGFLEWVLPEYGLAPGWSGRLYEFLGRLQPELLIVESAALMHWLRTAARTLPYQTLAEAKQTQRDTQVQIKQYFDRQNLALPQIPVERLFYEDVENPIAPEIPENALRSLLDQLASCWVSRPEKPLPESRVAFFNFIQEKTAGGKPVGFLELCRSFITRPTAQSRRTGTEVPATTRPTALSRRTGGRIGTLLQAFQENGQWYAVVNGLYPGGGKMFARWLPLFSPHVTDSLKSWLTDSNTQSTTPMSFPWQGYFNANSQPHLCPDVLLVPGGRLRPMSGGIAYQLGDLEVFWENGPYLRDRRSGQLIELTDLGLEAPEMRPPVTQLLWRLAVPYVSLGQLLPDDMWKPMTDPGILYHARYCHQNLILARATWRVEPAAWQGWIASLKSEMMFFKRLRETLTELGVPRHFFAAFEGERAQYFDSDSPLFMQFLNKLLRQGRGVLWLTEMLPVPEERAQELVCEFAVF